MKDRPPTPIEIATDVALTRLDGIEKDRADRMRQYALTWEVLWRNAKAADAIAYAQQRQRFVKAL